MITIEQAKEIIQDQNLTLQKEHKSIENCLYQYLAEEILAPFDRPRFSNSAVDGYAVCGLYPNYKVIGEISAGDGKEHSIQPGEGMRIFTGAKIPKNTTSIVMQEDILKHESIVTPKKTVGEGQNIREKGEEIRQGQVLLEKGHYVSAATIGLLAAFGIQHVSVFRKPKISILTTGNELVSLGEELPPAGLYNSNQQLLSAALQSQGFDSSKFLHCKDDLKETETSISEGLETSDLLLISGGVSVGDYDFVPQALTQNGVDCLFYKVNQKPGKPLYFGRKGDRFVFGLPGNPASTLMCFYYYVLPLLDKMMGGAGSGLPKEELALAHSFSNPLSRPLLAKANITENEVTILDGQASSQIRSFSYANALCYVEAECKLEKGETVICYRFQNH